MAPISVGSRIFTLFAQRRRHFIHLILFTKKKYIYKFFNTFQHFIVECYFIYFNYVLKKVMFKIPNVLNLSSCMRKSLVLLKFSSVAPVRLSGIQAGNKKNKIKFPVTEIYYTLICTYSPFHKTLPNLLCLYLFTQSVQKPPKYQ